MAMLLHAAAERHDLCRRRTRTRLRHRHEFHQGRVPLFQRRTLLRLVAVPVVDADEPRSHGRSRPRATSVGTCNAESRVLTVLGCHGSRTAPTSPLPDRSAHPCLSACSVSSIPGSSSCLKGCRDRPVHRGCHSQTRGRSRQSAATIAGRPACLGQRHACLAAVLYRAAGITHTSSSRLISAPAHADDLAAPTTGQHQQLDDRSVRPGM